MMMTIQLRYTGGSPWVFTPVELTMSNYNDLYLRAFDYTQTNFRCDWRHLTSYLLSDSELKDFARDASADTPRRYVMSWMFKATYSGIKHSPVYLVISDLNGDTRRGSVFTSMSNAKIWRSIVASFDAYLRKKIQKNEPVEYEVVFRYQRVGVAKRESRENILWSYSKENERRKYFDSAVEGITSILI